MGIKDNFTQAMKELTNPRPSDARKEVRDVASYMNDTADAQPTEPVQAVQNTKPLPAVSGFTLCCACCSGCSFSDG